MLVHINAEPLLEFLEHNVTTTLHLLMAQVLCLPQTILALEQAL
jgi:hypothetical protein